MHNNPAICGFFRVHGLPQAGSAGTRPPCRRSRQRGRSRVRVESSTSSPDRCNHPRYGHSHRLEGGHASHDVLVSERPPSLRSHRPPPRLPRARTRPCGWQDRPSGPYVIVPPTTSVSSAPACHHPHPDDRPSGENRSPDRRARGPTAGCRPRPGPSRRSRGRCGAVPACVASARAVAADRAARVGLGVRRAVAQLHPRAGSATERDPDLAHVALARHLQHGLESTRQGMAPVL